MLDSIPYVLEPRAYAEQLRSRAGVTQAGFLNAWRKGELPGLSASYVADVLKEWNNA